MRTYRASQIGACKRRLQLEAWGVEGLPTWEGTERAFYDGHMHELSIVEWAVSYKGEGWKAICKQKEILVAEGDGWQIVGHIDAILTKKGEERVLLECKALNKRAFQEFRERGVSSSQPQYLAQVQAYLHGLQALRHLRTAHALIITRNKETPRSRLYDHAVEAVEYDPDFASSLIGEVEALHHSIEKGEEIPPPYNPQDDWQCRPPWCPYTFVCWPEWRRERNRTRDASAFSELLEERQELKAQAEEISERLEEIDAALKESLEDGDYVAGRWALKLQTRRSERVDGNAVRKLVSPELLPKLIKVSEYRVLTIRGLEEG